MFLLAPHVYQLEYLLPMRDFGEICCLTQGFDFEKEKLALIEATYDINIITDAGYIIKKLNSTPEEVVTTDSTEFYNINWSGGIRLSHGATLKSGLYKANPATEHGHTFSKVCTYGPADEVLYKNLGWTDDTIVKLRSPKYDLVKKEVQDSNFILYCPTWNWDRIVENALYLKNVCSQLSVPFFVFPHPLTQKFNPIIYNDLILAVGDNIPRIPFSIDLIRNCSIFISDASSTILDALYYKKPVICYTQRKEEVKTAFIAPFVSIIDSNTENFLLSNLIANPNEIPKLDASSLFWEYSPVESLQKAIGGSK